MWEAVWKTAAALYPAFLIEYQEQKQACRKDVSSCWHMNLGVLHLNIFPDHRWHWHFGRRRRMLRKVAHGSGDVGERKRGNSWGWDCQWAGDRARDGKAQEAEKCRRIEKQSERADQVRVMPWDDAVVRFKDLSWDVSMSQRKLLLSWGCDHFQVCELQLCIFPACGFTQPTLKCYIPLLFFLNPS